MKRDFVIPAIIVLLAMLGGCGIMQCAKATVPAGSPVAGPYACDGSDTTFSIPATLGLDSEDDLQVLLVDSDGNQTVLTKTTHYSITGANANDPEDLTEGGTVTTVATYSSDYTIWLVRSSELSSTLDIDDEDVEDAIDKLTRIAQELAEKFDRAIHIQVSETGANTLLEPAGTAGYVYRSSDGDFSVALPMEIGDANVTPFMEDLLAEPNAAEARSNLSAAKSFWIDVTDAPYNATGDGATDDTAAIQAAFDAAGDGDTIFFPPGQYVTSAALTLDGSYASELTVRGAAGPDWYGSKKSVIWCTDPNANIIESQVNVVQFENLCFRSGALGTSTLPSGTGHGLVIGHPENTTNDYQIRNCWFQCIAQTAIVLSYEAEDSSSETDLTRIENCVIELCKVGIDLRRYTTNTKIINNQIYGPHWAIQADNGYGLEIQGNHLKYGNIDVNEYYDVLIQNNWIGSFTTTNPNRHAISLTDVDWAVVTGNEIYQTPWCGIYSSNGQRNLIANNVLKMNQAKLTEWAGIWLAGTETETFVVGNQVDHYTSQYGVKYGLYTEATTTLIGIGQNYLTGWEAPSMILGTVQALDSGPMIVKDGDLTVYDNADLSAEQVADGDFATDPASSGWTLNSGWTWDNSNYEVDHSSGTGTLAYSFTATAGRFYQLTFTIKNYSGTNTLCVLARIGNNYLQWADGNGTFTHIIQASNTAGLTFTPITGFDGSIDDVSLKEIIGGDISAGGMGRFNQVIQDVNRIAADITNFQAFGTHIIDSSGGAITGALADGTVIGQTVRFVCKTAGNNIDISVAHHVTSDPEVIRLNTAKEWVELIWDSVDWVEVGGSGQTYP
jgi:hypothetical protein